VPTPVAGGPGQATLTILIAEVAPLVNLPDSALAATKRTDVTLLTAKEYVAIPAALVVSVALVTQAPVPIFVCTFTFADA
jgi:hypothetical protein